MSLRTLMPEGEYSAEATLIGHTSPIVALEFSHDGKFLASGANNGVVLIFSTSSWVSLGNFVDASPVAVMTWYVGRRYLLLCGHQSGDLHLLTFTGLMENFAVWTSTFNGPIHSLSIFPASRCVAIAYGSDVVLTEILFNPHRLADERKHLPKLPSISQSLTKLPDPIASSLHFLGNKNRLLVTYATHGIVHWDTLSMSVIQRITPRTCPIGRSAVNGENTILAVANLIDGVDWYSLSENILISATKPPYAQKLCNSFAPVFLESDCTVMIGGTNGKAHILGLESFLGSLDHNGAGEIRSAAFASNVRGRKLIAIGATGTHGEMRIAIWSSASRRGMYIRPHIAFKDVISTISAWNQIFVVAGLLLLSCAWAVHLIGRLP